MKTFFKDNVNLAFSYNTKIAVLMPLASYSRNDKNDVNSRIQEARKAICQNYKQFLVTPLKIK